MFVFPYPLRTNQRPQPYFVFSAMPRHFENPRQTTLAHAKTSSQIYFAVRRAKLTIRTKASYSAPKEIVNCGNYVFLRGRTRFLDLKTRVQPFFLKSVLTAAWRRTGRAMNEFRTPNVYVHVHRREPDSGMNENQVSSLRSLRT